MSTPSPDAYEQGRGMDAHNAVMRDIRAERSESTTRPSPPGCGSTRTTRPTGW